MSRIPINPYESPTSTNSAADYALLVGDAYEWEGHSISVSAEMIPRFFPLIGQFWISIDGGTPFTSRQLRLQEKFEFAIRHNGRDFPAMFESYGLGFGRQPFRIFVNGKLVVDSIVDVDRGRIGFLLGILIGMAIVPVAAIVLALIMTILK